MKSIQALFRFKFRSLLMAMGLAVHAAAPCPALAESPRTPADAVPSVPPPLDLPYPQIVDPERAHPGSISVGTTSQGRLHNPAHLPNDGPAHYVLPEHLERDTHWGTDSIVGLILRAAERVHAVHGVRVGVGNISAHQGGRFRWSRSHNNGRDADIAFFYTNAGGEPVEVETLLQVDRRGVTRDRTGRRFDVARSWTLVEALLTDPGAQVQWIFVYNPLKQALLDYAASSGVAPELLDRASRILHQPGDSARHDDHFHLRIYCGRNDLLEGCNNWGPEWPEVEFWSESVELRLEELLEGVSDPDAQVAISCAERALGIGGASIATRLAAALPQAADSTRLALIGILAELDEPHVAPPIVELLATASHPEVRTQAAWVLGRLADPDSAAPLARLIREGGDPLPDGRSLPQAAAESLRNVWGPAGIEDLVAALPGLDAQALDATLRVLERVTGVGRHEFAEAAPDDSGSAPDGAGSQDPASALVPEIVAQHWQAWLQANADRGQPQWYASAFSKRGYGDGTAWESIPLRTLVQALEDEEEHIRFIADRALLSRSNGWTPSEGWTTERRVRYWTDRLGIPRNRR